MRFWTLVRAQLWELRRNLFMLQMPITTLFMAAIFRLAPSGESAQILQGCVLLLSALTVGWMTVALSLGEEREKRVLEALLLTPARPAEIIGAKLLVGTALSAVTGALGLLIFGRAPERPLLLLAAFGVTILFSLACGLLTGLALPDFKTASGFSAVGTCLIFFSGFPVFQLFAPRYWEFAAYLPARPLYELLIAGATGAETAAGRHFAVGLTYAGIALALCLALLRRRAFDR
jgi:ABC-type Na+ efflux pump permease subunit